ncbi:MAG: hypothetical protein ACR2F6_17850 [Mycobacteriales bacterium]
MDVAEVVLAALVVIATSVLFVGIIVVAARRLLGLSVGLGRAVVAGAIGLAFEFVFGLQVHASGNRTGAYITLQLGLSVLAAMLVLALAEAAVPSGTWPRPVDWMRVSSSCPPSSSCAPCSPPSGATSEAAAAQLACDAGSFQYQVSGS